MPDFSYQLTGLPTAIRKQVEDFIEFLLRKYEQDLKDSSPQKPKLKASDFVEKWAGFLVDVDPDQAKFEYLSDKHS